MYLYLCNELAICSALLVLLSQLALHQFNPLKALCLPVGMDPASTAVSLQTEKCMTKWATRLRIKHSPLVPDCVSCYQGCVDVRINDRGPYIGRRELDLSYGAAQMAIGN